MDGKQLEEHFALGKKAARTQGIKKNILKRMNLSEVKMGRCSPVCETLHLKVVENIHNNVLQLNGMVA